MQADMLPRTEERSQADLVEAFSNGAVEGVRGQVVRIDTHLNHVFLAGDRAFKLKRAVQLPFVDFSTVSQRRAACNAELAVNMALGSPFYVRVAPVSRTLDGHFRLGGEGRNADWVVEMRRFDSAGQFDVLAKAGALKLELVEQAAALIADTHARAPATQLMGHTADYRHTIRFLQETEAAAAASLGMEPGLPTLYADLDRELARISPLIERRRETGKVRRTHGDLHLGNICVFEGVPALFDALEFDERMATTDILYDLSFFLMDLQRHDLSRYANAAMNRYWDEADEEEEALQLLPFFMSLRATVRMAVAVAQGKLEEAQAYRGLSFKLLERRSRDVVAIGGLSGSGKSAVARELAPRLAGPAGARILRTDVLRKRALGKGAGEPAGDGAYTPDRRGEVYRELARRLGSAAQTGASVIADATFSLSGAGDAILAVEPGIRRYWLEAPLQVRLARIAGRSKDVSDADPVVAIQQEVLPDPGPGWRRIDARRPVKEIVSGILGNIP